MCPYGLWPTHHLSCRPEKVYPTKEAALQRLVDSSTFLHGQGNVTEESAGVILERGARQVEGGWQFTRDRRLQVTNSFTSQELHLHLTLQVTSLYGLPPDFLLAFCRSITCPHLLVKVTHHLPLHNLLQSDAVIAKIEPERPLAAKVARVSSGLCQDWPGYYRPFMASQSRA